MNSATLSSCFDELIDLAGDITKTAGIRDRLADAVRRAPDGTLMRGAIAGGALAGTGLGVLSSRMERKALGKRKAELKAMDQLASGPHGSFMASHSARAQSDLVRRSEIADRHPVQSQIHGGVNGALIGGYSGASLGLLALMARANANANVVSRVARAANATGRAARHARRV